MNTYKITNITNLVGKRDPKFNSVANIEYVDNRTKKVIALKAGDSVFLTVSSLPLSVHRLRIKKLIDIVEISAAELQKNMQKPKSKTKLEPKVIKKSVAKKATATITEEEAEAPVIEKKTTSRKKKVVED